MVQTPIFGISYAAQFFMEIVQTNFVSFSNHPTAKEAFNMCSSLWHLIDWITQDTTINKSGKSITEIRQILEPKCPSLSLMHDITTLSKHASLSRPRGNIVSTDAEFLGAIFHFGPSGPISEHPAKYKLTFDDGSTCYLHDEILKCMQFWEGFLKQQPTF